MDTVNKNVAASEKKAWQTPDLKVIGSGDDVVKFVKYYHITEATASTGPS